METVLQLYDKYANNIYRIALSYLRNVQDAEDIVQAVFLKLAEGKAVPQIDAEKAFLIRITINLCKDALRKSERRMTQPLDENIPFKDSEDAFLFDAVMSLPTKYRIVIYLHYYEGYTFKEIASLLKISSSAVSMRIHRARKELKELLREDNYAQEIKAHF